MGNFVYCIFIFTGFYANMGNYVYCTIHIYSILRGHGKLCLLYNSHFKDSTRIWETMYIVYSYFQDSTRIWETTKGLEIVSLSLGWKRISSNSWLNVQLRHNLTGLQTRSGQRLVQFMLFVYGVKPETVTLVLNLLRFLSLVGDLHFLWLKPSRRIYFRGVMLSLADLIVSVDINIQFLVLVSFSCICSFSREVQKNSNQYTENLLSFEMH